MNTLHRTTLLTAASIATVVALTISPAQAAWQDKAALASLSVSTETVKAPTNLSTAGTKCATSYDAAGNPTTTLQAKVSWTASPTAKVTSYEVKAYTSGWSYSVTTVAAPATTVTGSYDSYYASQNVQVTVTAKTSYGWFAESTKSKVITC